MARPREYRYMVEGEGRFPLDMLRYDMSYPASETDSNAIANTFNEGYERRWRVELVSKRRPTAARWASFNWRVSDASWR